MFGLRELIISFFLTLYLEEVSEENRVINEGLINEGLIDEILIDEGLVNERAVRWVFFIPQIRYGRILFIR